MSDDLLLSVMAGSETGFILLKLDIENLKGYKISHVNSSFLEIVNQKEGDLLNHDYKILGTSICKAVQNALSNSTNGVEHHENILYSENFGLWFKININFSDEKTIAVTLSKLQDDKQIYHKIFEYNPLGIVHFDGSGTICDVNREFIRVVGSSAEELLGLNMVLHLKNIEIIDSVKRALTGQTSYYSGYYTSVTGNKTSYVKGIFVPLNEGEKIIGGIGIFEDITDKISTEYELHKKDLFLRAIIENLPFEFWARDKNMVGIFENSKLKAHFGTILDKTPDNHIFEDNKDREIWKNNNQRVLNGETIIEDVNYKIKGEEKVFEQLVFPVKDTSSVIGIAGINIDVTDKRKSERIIVESEEKYRLLAENSTDVIWTMGLDGKYLYVSPSVFYLRGISPEENMNETFFDTLTESSAHEAIKMFEYFTSIIKAGEKPPPQTFEMEQKHKNGNSIWTEIMISAVFESTGEFKYFLGVTRDITERRKSADALHSSIDENKRLQTLFREVADNISDMIWAKDSNGNFTFANESLCKNLLLTDSTLDPIGKNELYYATIAKREKPENPIWYTFGETSIETDKEVIESGETRHYELYGTVRGNYVCLDVIKSPLKDENGDIIGIVAAGRDITDKKRDELVKRLYIRISSAVTEFDDIQECLSIVQNELNTITDASNFEVFYKEHNELRPIYSQVGIKECSRYYTQLQPSLLNIVLSDNKTLRLSLKEIMKLIKDSEEADISCLPKSWIGIPLRKNGKSEGVLVIKSFYDKNAYSDREIENLEFIAQQIANTIEKKRIAKQLQLLSASVEQSPVSILITDNKGVIEYVNPKFCDITGYSYSEAIGNNPKLLKSGFQSDDVYTKLWNKISNGEVWKGELHNKKKNGDYFWEFANISPIFNEKGAITHYLAVKEDITEYKKIIKELIESKAKALESERVKSAFLANMSHEIRTPLNGILGFASILSDSELSKDAITEYASIINSSGTRLLELLNNIMDISKIESGETYVVTKPFKPYTLLEELSKTFSIQAKNKNIDLKIEVFEIYHDFSLFSDYLKIRQVLTNFVSNAIKFTENGSITLGFENKESFVSFYVKDTGKGISKEHQDKIFDRFYQIEDSYSRGYEGAGLGLSLCREIALLLNGAIRLDSAPDQGSTFYLDVPVHTEPTK